MAYEHATKKRGATYLEPKQNPPAGKRIWNGRKTSGTKPRGKQAGRE